MTTIWEETKKQGSKMKGRPLSEKIAYFWEYYKIHTLVGATVLILVISLVHAWATSKDYILSIVMVNSIAAQIDDIDTNWISDLNERIEYDPKKYEIYLDTTMLLGQGSESANQEYANLQKLAAMISAQSIDIFIADTESFERYAQNEYMYDLRNIYTEEELQKYSDILYYTDAATFSDYSSDVDPNAYPDQSVYIVDHHDPDSMKDPVPIGFFADDTTVVGSSGAYAYLNPDDMFQGHPKEGVIGIMINTPRLDNAKIGIDYLTGKDKP
ncbi:MAG: hypothetical protein J5509_07675 [Lachnospiraceae bacterium]|nr:hypothetical protein [Lachnospiraceae bacterium]